MATHISLSDQGHLYLLTYPRFTNLDTLHRRLTNFAICDSTVVLKVQVLHVMLRCDSTIHAFYGKNLSNLQTKIV
jgi:hypothetical protein